MRSLFVVFLFLVCDFANATNYYFSSSAGDDSRTATQARYPATPWKSLQKLNAIFPTLQPGDSVLLKRGDAFEGSLTVTKSGTASSPVVIAAYGSGNKPLISGFATLKSFSFYSNNVWVQTLNTNQPNVLLLNGKAQPLGRYPNAAEGNGGYLNFESHAGTTTITDNELNTGVNWTGAELVIRKRRWILDRCKITGQSGGTLTYATVTATEPANNYGYFIQNHLKTLDRDGEWSFDASQKKLYLYQSGFSPATTEIKASVVDTLVYINFKNYITLKDLQFQGANESAIVIINSGNVSVSGCDLAYTGANGVLLNNVANVVVENSSFNYSNNNAINTLYNCRGLRFRNNSIRNTGIYPGMGKSGDMSYQAITMRGQNCLAEYNRIDSTGYVPIRFEGDSAIVRNNVVTNFMWVKDDGGGIYTWNNGSNAVDNLNRVVKDNIVTNGIGAGPGTATPTESHAHGIYMDDNSANVEISGNTVTACGESGLYIHNSHNIGVTNNTLYNNARQLYLQHDNTSPTKPNRNIRISGNILYAKTPSQFLIYSKSMEDDIALFGTSDNNYFCSPFQSHPSIYTAYTRNNYEFVQVYDLSSWQRAMKMDLSSKAAPAQIAPYQTTALLSANKIVNGGTFDNDIKGVYSYVYAGAFRVEWNSGGKLDGGCLQLTMDTVTNNRGYAIMDLGPVTAGKAYLLRFSLVGKSSNKSLSFFLRKTGAPYTRISDIGYCKVLNTRTENEFLIIPKETVSAASLLLDVSDQNTVWVDNLKFYEASLTQTKPDQYLRHECNATAVSKTCSLDANYVDARNLGFAGSISLQPFTSSVLLKTGVVIKKAQTITFPAISGKTEGDQAFSLTATASSGLPVSYRVVSGPALVTGSTVTLTGAGTVSIEASQAGDATYNAATPVTQSFTITAAAPIKQAQSISFPALASKSFGDAPFALNATASSGLPVTYRVVKGPATVSGNLVSLNDTGTVTIEASQAGNATYNQASPVLQSCVVVSASAKLDQAISFGTLAYKTYASESFALSAVASSGLPVNYRVVSGPVALSGNVVTITGVGAVTIEAMQTGNRIYNAALPVQRSFTVGKASQTIGFPVLANKVFGVAAFSPGATASSGLAVSYRVTSGPALVQGNNIVLTGVGTVTIEATQAGNTYYIAANKVTRSFDVIQSVLAVTTGAVDGMPVEGGVQGSGENSLRIYPNPIVGSGTVEVRLAKAMKATVAVYDLQGKQVKNLGEHSFAAGQSVRISLDALELPAGTYIIQLAAQEHMLSQRFIRMK